MPRPCHCRRVSALPKNRCFKPNGVPLHDLEEIVLSLDGLEALRLADVEDMNMDVAAAQMGVSRHTFGRLLRRARQCVAQALVQGMTTPPHKNQMALPRQLTVSFTVPPYKKAVLRARPGNLEISLSGTRRGPKS